MTLSHFDSWWLPGQVPEVFLAIFFSQLFASFLELVCQFLAWYFNHYTKLDLSTADRGEGVVLFLFFFNATFRFHISMKMLRWKGNTIKWLTSEAMLHTKFYALEEFHACNSYYLILSKDKSYTQFPVFKKIKILKKSDSHSPYTYFSESGSLSKWCLSSL